MVIADPGGGGPPVFTSGDSGGSMPDGSWGSPTFSRHSGGGWWIWLVGAFSRPNVSNIYPSSIEDVLDGGVGQTISF